jgi:hypothetical protein
MADVEDPDGSSRVEAEPTECCRCMVICVMGLSFLAPLAFLELFTGDFRGSHPSSTTLALVVGLLGFFSAIWFGFYFMILVAEWYNGNPEGQRVVDRLIQSDRGVFQESIHQFLQRVRRVG